LIFIFVTIFFSLEKWELFRLPELDCFQAMLNRLYRTDMEQLVMSFELIRSALQQEIEQRLQKQNTILDQNVETKV
jgi:scaffold protein salvador